MTDTIDSHTDASGEPTTETGSGSPVGAATEARTSTATLERPAPTPAPVPRAGALPTPSQQAQAAKDKPLTSPAAVELARHALEEITDPITVGEYLAAAPNAERLVTHLFDCTLSGYRGWRWAVTLSRVPRSRTATVCEMELLPGEEALLAPAWVPWADRLEPGDITRSDRLPRKETDERLEPGWEATGEDADAVALDQLDLGRPGS
ncbi:PF11228 domain protein [Actinomyces naeslundii str. Howell 279]|uniref:PF11228 domain protein n=1 Tax=Actinomyces naeslundii (strain ATCC 12104 / DSM 43013 / CCUG 2238 / JCM 8349 / NCTC 10301 / Howell 279) TaxID=1115803 RepID=J3F453_ACTNH|nr:PF11228 domain protein [Actinomyces naeslundii str. Howell 279]